MPLFRRRTDGESAGGDGGLRGLFRGRAGSDASALDPAYGDQELAGLRARAAVGDWAAVRDGLSEVPDEADLTWLLAVLSEVPGIERWIPDAVAAEPDSALPLLLSGARQIAWAWEARTGARAKYVSEEQWKTFGERLAVAEEQLYEVAEREPQWLAPWYFLQISARGASLGPDVGRYRFDAAVRRRPGHLGSHRQRLQQVCAKWGGSHEQMHDFARTAMLSAPEGSPLGELVALAHLEHWLDLDSGADRAHMAGQAVRDQLHEAADRSIRHPDYQRPRGWKSAYNTFAMAFYVAGQPKAADLLFRELGGTVTEAPWHYLDRDPVQAYRTARDACAR
ncbi:hypothetical protein [Kitasatospora sp. NPDC057015]|uniref:hypothetical protein n=1 Tax=Kitasatospora sp. NPDC057015 TaxID=3346001 RepID=UPI00362CF8D5